MEAGTVLYEAELLHFAEDLKKWKDRYVVIKNDYTVDCFETKEVNASSSYVLLRFQIYWVSSEFATAAAFLLAILDETLSSARQLQPCRAVWKLHGDG